MSLSDIATQTTALYRYYDQDDRLLYVGIANEPFRRMAQHRHGKGWWTEVVRVDIEQFDSRPEAAEAERLAIVNEHPLYNITHAPRPTPTAPLEVTAWCAVCGHQVLAGAGYVCVDVKVAIENERVWHEYEKTEPESGYIDVGGMLEAHRDLVPWTVLHAACDPHPERDDYWFDVGRSTPLAALLDWNAHLLEKRWIQHTNWTRFLVAAATDSGLLRVAE